MNRGEYLRPALIAQITKRIDTLVQARAQLDLTYDQLCDVLGKELVDKMIAQRQPKPQVQPKTPTKPDNWLDEEAAAQTAAKSATDTPRTGWVDRVVVDGLNSLNGHPFTVATVREKSAELAGVTARRIPPHEVLRVMREATGVKATGKKARVGPNLAKTYIKTSKTVVLSPNKA